MGQDQPVKLMGQGKNQVKVSHRQKLRGLLLQPPGLGQRLAFGTVAVTAGVVGRALKAAGIAAIQIPRRNSCSPAEDPTKRPASLFAGTPIDHALIGSSPRTDERYRPARGVSFSLLPLAIRPAAWQHLVRAGRRADRASLAGWRWRRAWAGESANSAGCSEASCDPTAS